jgi:Glycosyl transferase family 8
MIQNSKMAVKGGENVKYICTYFDYNFLPRGLALYNSIKKFHDDFVFYALVFDNETFEYLSGLNLINLKPVSFETYNKYFDTNQEKFEDRKQYFFSSTPNICLYLFETYSEIDQLLYLDADVYVFNSLDSLYHEVGDASIAFCAHRFNPVFNLLSKNYGRYNVGVNFFKRTRTGLQCLHDWKNDCDSWYPGKPGYPLNFFSDQIFLDKWPMRYQEIKIIENIGINTAPWNIASYKVRLKSEEFYINENKLIIYHFSALKKNGEGLWNANTIYFFGSVRGNLMKLYQVYIRELESIGLQNSKIVSVTHENSIIKRVFYFIMSFILNESIEFHKSDT